LEQRRKRSNGGTRWRGMSIAHEPEASQRSPAPGASRAVDGRNNRFGIWEIESARHAYRAGFTERGRRRTRQDQISLEAWRPGEIAELGRSAPNEENQFLLPDRFSTKRLSPSKGRSSRLT
jgi:hypothetical protein